MIGIIFNRRYRMDAELGRGGVGVVYRAYDTLLNRTVAVKLLASGTLASAGAIHRFRTEAVAAGSLQHPNIVAVPYLDIPTLGQPQVFIQVKDGLFDEAVNIGANSRKFLQNWMDQYVAWVKKHTA